MEFDKSAYVLYHSAQTGFPCLSFDIIPDEDGSGDERLEKDNISLFLVTGTQAPKAHLNTIHVLHLSRMTKFKQKDSDAESDDDSESEESDGEPDSQPVLKSAEIPHQWGAINRIRFSELNSNMLAASWCDSGRVRIWNLNKQLQELKNSFFNKSEATLPIFTFSGHQSEGFAIDWSNVNKGYLASGDCAKHIHIWKPNDEGTWHVDQTPLIGHTESVEDIQWSPTEANVLASCSVDKSIRVWDIRGRNPSSACMITIDDAHQSDVNVISWNRLDTYFLLSGGDDGTVKVWDFRKFANASKSSKPIAIFKYHLAPITSVEWNPSDNTVFGVSGEDNQITLWDLAVEKDDEQEMETEEDKEEEDNEDNEDEQLKAEKNAPPQLLFAHKGQRDIKELHFHPQIPGLVVSTAANSFDIFKTISV